MELRRSPRYELDQQVTVTNLEDKLQGYLTLIENHYRYYQFYANMFIAAAFSLVFATVESVIELAYIIQ